MATNRASRLMKYALAFPLLVPKTVRQLRVRVKPDQVNNYMNLVKSETLPAMEKAGSRLSR